MGIWTAALLLIAVLEVVCGLFTVVPSVSAQGPQGSSIFVDCGSNANYSDQVTNISWVPDAQYITTGVNANVPSAQANYSAFIEFTTVRYFPDSRAKNCYSFPVGPNQTYMIRGTFFYGYYDNATTLPSFQMGIDGTIVANVTFDDGAGTFVYREFTYLSELNTNITFLCLLRDSSNSVPFISAISFSQLPNDYFDTSVVTPLYQGKYVESKYRLNFGGDVLVRHPGDNYDRYWFPEGPNSTFLYSSTPPQVLMTSQNVTNNKLYGGVIPEAVIDTALTTTGGNMTIFLPDKYDYTAVVTFYYAELNTTANATSRQFYVEFAGNTTDLFNPFVNATGTFTADAQFFGPFPYTSQWEMVLYENQNFPSPLGPLVNALEVLEVSENQMTQLTNLQDALAIEQIKLDYTNLGNWTGDPCVPKPHPWVTCSISDPPLITTVDLSDYNLTGPISPHFADLQNLTSLSLQNNMLSGDLPAGLGDLQSLQNLNLQSNMLTGGIPASLGGLKSLQKLSLQNNMLSGDLPAELGDLQSLQNLSLQYNMLTGGIPASFGGLQSLQQLNLQSNMLTGDLPDGLGDLQSLQQLNLQSNMLTGDLPTWLGDLKSLQQLNLQNNTLSGGIPASLGDLKSLQQLFVQMNNLSGPIPPSLLRTNNSHWLFIYTPGNPFLQLPTSNPKSTTSNPKSTNIGIIIGSVVGGILALVIIICIIVKYFQALINHGNPNITNGQISSQGAKPYSLVEVIAATNDFETMIGKGGFGPVYYGKLEDGQEVAIKVLDVKSSQGPSEFFNEVDVLSRVSHRNLVSLIGYCYEDNQPMLIYEYMHKGSLRDHLYGDLGTTPTEQLDWKTRMNIVLNAAQGLDYLHFGSNQSIIHRDIKSSNILLSSKMENAKVADFGLSRLIYGDDDITHVTTNVKGTTGYFDPEYFTTQCLSLKSDVYSFGVVLLEVISGRMPIDTTLPNRHAWNLCEWVRSNLQVGNIDNILDPIVKASNPQLDALWKVAEIAIQCVEPKSIHRPTMTKVVEELRAAILQEESHLNIHKVLHMEFKMNMDIK